MYVVVEYLETMDHIPRELKLIAECSTYEKAKSMAKTLSIKTYGSGYTEKKKPFMCMAAYSDWATTIDGIPDNVVYAVMPYTTDVVNLIPQ